MSLVGRKVRLVRVHQNTHVEGLGNVGPSITTSVKTHGDMDLTREEGGVHLKTKGGVEGFIPDGNIVYFQLEIEPKKAKS